MKHLQATASYSFQTGCSEIPSKFPHVHQFYVDVLTLKAEHLHTEISENQGVW